MCGFVRCAAAALATGWLTLAATAQTTQPILADPFAGAALGADWKVDASAGNTVSVHDGALEINAHENTFAHVERPLDRDLIRASCEIQAGSGISWATSLFLYWGPADWCQIGIIPRAEGRYYACITSNGQREEHDLARCRLADSHPVAIELGQDVIRFMSKPANADWRTEFFLPRPQRLLGPPKLLIVGKGFGVDASSSTLNSDYGDRGEPAISRIRKVQIESTPADHLHVTAAEQKARDLELRDPLGAQILERKSDPDYDTVAAVLPAMTKPREVVGVKDHPFEIGVAYDGTIQLPTEGDGWEQNGPTVWFEIDLKDGKPPVRFGMGGVKKFLGFATMGGAPVVMPFWQHGGIDFFETVLGASKGMSPDTGLYAYVRLVAANAPQTVKGIHVILRQKVGDTTMTILERDLAPVARNHLFEPIWLRIPVPLHNGLFEEVTVFDFKMVLDETHRIWSALFDGGMQVTTPEPRVNDAWRAWLAYNYLDVDKKGDVYEPHDGSGFYEEVFGYSADLYCHALDLWGRHDDARRYLESLLTILKPEGLFYVNYGLPDQGGLLYALSEHYRLTGDADWLKTVAAKMQKMCDWLIAEREKALAEPNRDARTHGLIKFAPYCDYQNPTFSFYGDAYSAMGLEHTARVFREIGLTEPAERIAKAAAAYKVDLLACMDAAIFEHDGQKFLPMEPDTQRHLKATNYLCKRYYGLVASMLLEADVLAPTDPRAMLVVRGLENRGGLILGMCEFDDGVDHAYTYGYWLNCLHRDDIRRVLLGFYGSLAYGMGRDTYCGVEVTQLTTGEPTPTTPHLYSGTQQLRLLRMMLVDEDGDDLVLGRAIPQHWLASNKPTEVRRAPTGFGEVSYRIEPALDQKLIRVYIDPPTRRPPKSIRVYLRHPHEQPIREVHVSGQPITTFEPAMLRLTPTQNPMEIEIRY